MFSTYGIGLFMEQIGACSTLPE